MDKQRLAERRDERDPLPYDARDEIARTLVELAGKHQVPGAQLAIHHSDRTTAWNFGELAYGRARSVTRDAAFPIGSISKCFTATVAMILVADGDLDLGAPVGEYLPGLDDLGEEVTLRQVLSHTSGLAAGPDPQDVAGCTVRRFVRDYCRHDDLVVPPGTGFSYSNAGYALVGDLIETITGMTWPEATESILLRPLGIEPAFLAAPGAPPADRPIATGHSVNAARGRTRPVAQSVVPAQAPAGGLAASAADLVTLGLMHVGRGVPDLLPARYAEQMRRAVPGAEPFGLADGWGLGLAVFGDSGTEWVGHDGNADGTSCYLRIDPAGGWVVAFTSNANTGYALWNELRAALSRVDVPIARPTRPARVRPIASPPACVGTYVNGDVEYVVASTRQRPHLYLSVDGDPFVKVTVSDGLAFWMHDPDSGRPVFGGRFLRDPGTGAIDRIQVGGRLARRRTTPQTGHQRKLTA